MADVIEKTVYLDENLEEKELINEGHNFGYRKSVFKRPDGHFVGKMVEELGLKGFSIGGAKVSEKHAGFIVNTGNATANDIKKLIKYIKEKVKEKYDVELETEVLEVGEWE